MATELGKLTSYVPGWVKDQLQSDANERGTSLSQVVKELLMNQLKKEKYEQGT